MLDWINYARFILSIAKDGCAIVIAPETSQFPGTAISLGQQIAPENERIAERQLKLLLATKRILDFIGATSRPLRFEGIVENAKQIFEFAALLDGDANQLSIGILPVPDEEKQKQLREMKELETLVINFLTIDEIVIGYSIVASLTLRETGDGFEIFSESFRVSDVLELKNITDGFDQFVEIQKSKSTFRGLVINQPFLQVEGEPGSAK